MELFLQALIWGCLLSLWGFIAWSFAKGFCQGWQATWAWSTTPGNLKTTWMRLKTVGVILGLLTALVLSGWWLWNSLANLAPVQVTNLLLIAILVALLNKSKA